MREHQNEFQKLSLVDQHKKKVRMAKGQEQRTSSLLPYKIENDQSQQLQQKPKENSEKRQNHIFIGRESAFSESLAALSEGNSKQQKNLFMKNLEASKILSSIHHYMLKEYDGQTNQRYVLNLYQGVEFALKKLKHPSQEFVLSRSKFIDSSNKNKKKFLFLDLDQTLISAHYQTGYEFQRNLTSFQCVIRPFANAFLEQLQPYYDIYVFTSSTRVYAESIVSKLNKSNTYIKGVLARQNCYSTKKGRFVKDLRIIKDRSLKDIVVIDNLVESFSLQLSNGIPILPFNGQPEDRELSKLIPYLKDLSEAQDVRPLIQKRYKLAKILEIKREDMEFFFEFLSD